MSDIKKNIILISLIMVLFTNIAIASNVSVDGESTKSLTSTPTPTSTVTISANASSLAIGNDTNTLAETNVTNTSAEAFTFAEASAENGSNATVQSKSSTSFLGEAIATANAFTSVVSHIGQKVWIYAVTLTTSSKDSAKSKSQSIISDTQINVNSINKNGEILYIEPSKIPDPDPISTPEKKNIQIVEYTNPSFGGSENFGTSEIERYCVWKIQSSSTDEYIKKHAIYNMEIKANDYHNISEYENKYKITNESCIEKLTNKTVFETSK